MLVASQWSIISTQYLRLMELAQAPKRLAQTQGQASAAHLMFYVEATNVKRSLAENT